MKSQIELQQIRSRIVKRDDLYCALSETMHALQLTESAVGRFVADTDALETGSRLAISVAYLKNQLSDAQELLAAAEGEIGQLIEQNDL